MNTGVTSLANLSELGAVYPFVGYEWLFAVLTAAFLVYFIAKQISMEKEALKEDALHAAETSAIVPAE